MNLQQTHKFIKTDKLVTMNMSVTLTDLAVGDITIKQIAEGFYEATCQGISHTGRTASAAGFLVHKSVENLINQESYRR